MLFPNSDVSRLIYARLAKSVFPVSTDNRCNLHFDWMIKGKQYRSMQCQQIGMFDIWGNFAVCSSNVCVAMWRHLPDTRCKLGLPNGDSREGWPGIATPYVDPPPQWVKKSFKMHVGCKFSDSRSNWWRVIMEARCVLQMDGLTQTTIPLRPESLSGKEEAIHLVSPTNLLISPENLLI